MRALPLLAFFLSGLSSLIFQMIWSRLLHHVFGSSSIAISSVVSVFMGGLGLGAWLGGRFADRLVRPLALYALAELAIGAYGLGVPFFVAPEGWLAEVNALLRRGLGADSFGFAFARFACIAPVLLVPTTLMGATLPLLARHFVAPSERSAGASTRVGTLYAVNTLGAVVGVFLAGFVLMPRIGVAQTNAAAASINLALGISVWALRRRLLPATGAADSDAPAANSHYQSVSRESQEGGSARRFDDLLGETGFPSSRLPVIRKPGPSAAVRKTAALGFALSGFSALLYEVVWSRALVNTVGGSVYAFALILLTFLVGIAGGSALCAWSASAAARLLFGAGVLAVTLTGVGLGPLALRGGASAWGHGVLASALVVASLGFAARRHSRALRVLDPDAVVSERGWALAALGVPLVAVALLAAYLQTRLGAMALSVVVLGCALVALCVALHARPVALCVALQAFIALATFTSEAWADGLAITFASMVGPLYEDLPSHVNRVLVIMFGTVALTILPAALAMGAVFPATLRVWTAGGARIGRDVGSLYTTNTVGSIFGAWLPGFVLMPWIGMQGALHVGIATNLACACALAIAAATHSRAGAIARPLPVGLGLAFAAVLAGLGWATVRRDTPLSWDLGRMTLGAFRIALAREVLDQETWGRPDLVYYRDGLSTTVSVERWGRHYSLKNNGKVEASNGDDMPTQIMVSALPLLLHTREPADLDVALVGFGSGVTAGAALQFPIRSLDVIELERAVVEASRFFADVNHLRYEHAHYPWVDTPRLRLHHDDGRNFLAAGGDPYDLIVSEPSNPWLTGVSDLFTRDHFRVAKKRLAPDGIYCQWVQLYELSPENVKVIYRTFAAQFRHVIVFSAEDLSSDTILIGSDAPLSLDLTRVRRRLALPGVAAELERAYVHSPHDVFARVLLASREEVMAYAQVELRRRGPRWTRDAESTNRGDCEPAVCRREPVPINTDDNALIEFAAPRDLIGYERYKGYLQTLYSATWPYGELSAALTGFGGGPEGAARYAGQALALLAHGRKAEAAAMLDAARELGDGPELALAGELWTALATRKAEPVIRPGEIEPDPVLRADVAERIHRAHREAIDWLGRDDAVRATRALDALPHAWRLQAGPELRLFRGQLLHRIGAHEEAIDALETLARDEPEFLLEHPELYYTLARAHDSLLHFDKAVRNMRVYVEARLLAPRAWSETPAEPGPAQAPVSDAPGESPKDRHEPT